MEIAKETRMVIKKVLKNWNLAKDYNFSFLERCEKQELIYHFAKESRREECRVCLKLLGLNEIRWCANTDDSDHICYCEQHMIKGYKYKRCYYNEIDLKTMFIEKDEKFLQFPNPHFKNFDWYKHCFPLGQKVVEKRDKLFVFQTSRYFDNKLFNTKNCFNRSKNFVSIFTSYTDYITIQYRNTEKYIETVEEKVMLFHFIMRKNKLPRRLVLWIIHEFYLEIEN